MRQLSVPDTRQLESLLASHEVRTLFQPVVAINTKQVVGFEAFSRGKEEGGDSSLVDLFDSEVDPAQLYELDKICCSQALQRFSKFLKQRSDFCLFINLDARALSKACCDKHFFVDIVSDVDVPVRNIVVEISSECLNEENGLKFIEFCRNKGFQICFDKVEHDSGLLAILLKGKPDYIKLQRSVWSDPSDPTFNVANIEHIVKSCAHVGCMPIAMGVESEDEVLYLLQANIFCHQGFFYTKSPGAGAENGDSVAGFLETVERIYAKFKKLHSERIKSRKEHFQKIKSNVNKIASLFSNASEEQFGVLLKRVLEKYDDVVSVFVLDEHGEQATQRFARDVSKDDPAQHRAILTKGSDHSLHDYFMHLLLGYDNFVTPPMYSPFYEESTILISIRFFSGPRTFHLLCVEFPAR
ncbi:EAL domain-containing protein [Desulfovibrio sp. JC022]|uniref:EAL domain-containing protein n=1 Tax=Desulfovibrio sp. JC022 TaxID=2593642 RepID=UPI0013D4F640|nr:EAL domain-containing protein [Desulfovibrio sp. JC022]NDV23026.1 EAL domain-containing protein [Desulfovibrio sp. JC022]